MKYILYSLMMIALSATLYSQSKTVQFGYTHYETTADPQNGSSCIAGTINCVGGGTTSTVIPSNGCVPAKTQVVTTPGTYSNFIKGLDADLSTLTSIRYVVKRQSDNTTLYDVTLNVGGGWPTSPTTFSATLQVAPNTANVLGSYYKSGDGNLIIVSPTIPGSVVSNTDGIVVSVDPTCSPTAGKSGSIYTSAGGVDEIATQDYSATAIAAMSKTGKLIPGDVKYSELNTDHDGWYLMNGRSVNTITNVSAKVAASSFFGASLPDMDQKYMMADHVNASRSTLDGQNSFTVANSNIQAATISTTTDGSHSHNLAIAGVDDGNWTGGWAAGDATNFRNWEGTTTEGSHNHSVTIGTGSPSSIDNRPRSKRIYAFVYLGE